MKSCQIGVLNKASQCCKATVLPIPLHKDSPHGYIGSAIWQLQCTSKVIAVLPSALLVSVQNQEQGSVPEECKICETVQGCHTRKSPGQPVVCRHVLPIKLALTHETHAYRGEPM